jgi:hypothetical protein
MAINSSIMLEANQKFDKTAFAVEHKSYFFLGPAEVREIKFGHEQFFLPPNHIVHTPKSVNEQCCRGTGNYFTGIVFDPL